MTTPNGHEAPNVGAGSEQASSTVLALDGWGPVVAEPAANGANGANGVEPDSLAHIESVAESVADDDNLRDAWRERMARTLPGSIPVPPVDSQLLRILASAAAMSIAVFVVFSLGRRLTTLDLAGSASFADAAGLRRRLALAIDPSLTPAPARAGRLAFLTRLLEL